MKINFFYKLAISKILDKKLSHFIIILTSSLIFSLVVVGIIIFNGVSQTFDNALNKISNGKYLVKVTLRSPEEKALRYVSEIDINKLREIKEFSKKYYQSQKEKIEVSGLKYEPSYEEPPFTPAAWMDKGLPDELRVTLNYTSSAVQSFIQKKAEDLAVKDNQSTFSQLKKIGERYDVKDYYSKYLIKDIFIPKARLIRDGKELFGADGPKTGNFTSAGYQLNAINNSAYEFQDDFLVDKFIQLKDSSKLVGVPVVVSKNEAVKLFGSDFIGKTYQVCWRNEVEQDLLVKVRQDYADIKNNVNNKDYIEPSLQYDYPSELCGDIILQKDTRIKEEKKRDENLIEQKKILEQPYKNEHKLITFQIVGYKNISEETAKENTLASEIRKLFEYKDESMSNTIPYGMYKAYVKKSGDNFMADSPKNVVDSKDDYLTKVLAFSDIQNAKNFIKNETCSVSDTSQKCNFYGESYGINYLLLNDIKSKIKSILPIVALIATGVAILVMNFTVQKSMSLNRRETAIYRAIGARKFTIFKIYYVYSFIVSMLIPINSIFLGTIISFILAYVYNPKLYEIAKQSVGNVILESEVKLFTPPWVSIGIFGTLIFICCCLSSFLPILLNSIRSPAKDLKED